MVEFGGALISAMAGSALWQDRPRPSYRTHPSFRWCGMVADQPHQCDRTRCSQYWSEGGNGCPAKLIFVTASSTSAVKWISNRRKGFSVSQTSTFTIWAGGSG